MAIKSSPVSGCVTLYIPFECNLTSASAFGKLKVNVLSDSLPKKACEAVLCSVFSEYGLILKILGISPFLPHKYSKAFISIS